MYLDGHGAIARFGRFLPTYSLVRCSYTFLTASCTYFAGLMPQANTLLSRIGFGFLVPNNSPLASLDRRLTDLERIIPPEREVYFGPHVVVLHVGGDH